MEDFYRLMQQLLNPMSQRPQFQASRPQLMARPRMLDRRGTDYLDEIEKFMASFGRYGKEQPVKPRQVPEGTLSGRPSTALG